MVSFFGVELLIRVISVCGSQLKRCLVGCREGDDECSVFSSHCFPFLSPASNRVCMCVDGSEGGSRVTKPAQEMGIIATMWLQ